MVQKQRKLNKRFAARCGSLIGVLLMMALLVLPAAAASGSSPVWYSVLPIDGVRLIQSSESVVDIPWAPDLFMSENKDMSAGDGSAGYGVANILPHFDENIVTYDVAFVDELSSFSSIVLYSDSCFIYTSDLKSKSFLVACGYDGDDGCRVDISFTAHRINSVGDTYQVSSSTVRQGFHLSPDGNVLALIDSMLSDGNFVPADVVYLTNLEIQFSQFENDDQWIQFSTDVRHTRASARKWVDQYELLISTEVIYEVVEGGFSFDWLVSSVDTFLSISLWPGFTIGGVLRVAIVIALIFLFAKMIV